MNIMEKTMSTKTKSPTTTTDKTVETQEPKITTIKKSTCKSLEGKATLTYRTGTDETSALYWQVCSNTGGGFFSDEWVLFEDIHKSLTDWAKESPITSMALRSVFKKGKSVNTPAFLMASLVKEGILDPLEGKKRQFQLGDVRAFLAAVDHFQETHKTAGKRKSKAKAQAGARMQEERKKPVKGK
jgi:hypothetical protein